MVWPTLGSRTAKEQNRMYIISQAYLWFCKIQTEVVLEYYFWFRFLGHRLPMTQQIGTQVCPSVRTSTKSFSNFHLIWCVGRPRTHMRTSVTSTRSKVKVTELPKLQKVHFSRSTSSAILAWSSKLMIGGHSMGPGLQLVGARFMNSHLGKLSREF